ncbi:MAG: hypothetical protein IK132_10200, partial [Clostridia bacterium]|nr:hypothetical protein [Clostridia bacterium]
VARESPWNDLFPQMKEAYFCCTMRLAEGLRYVKSNAELLYAETSGTLTLGENGVYIDSDLVYAEPDDELLPYTDKDKSLNMDGHRLSPLIKAYRVPWEILERTKQKVLF